jgi:hypothetical protein
LFVIPEGDLLLLFLFVIPEGDLLLHLPLSFLLSSRRDLLLPLPLPLPLLLPLLLLLPFLLPWPLLLPLPLPLGNPRLQPWESLSNRTKRGFSP